jgi:hypothetical protein
MILIPPSIAKCIFACYFGIVLSSLTSCPSPQYNLYFDSSFTTVISIPTLYKLTTFHVPNLMSMFLSLGRLYKESSKPEALCDIS